MVNPVCFFETPALDLDRAVAFYSAVFETTLERTTIGTTPSALFGYSPKQGGASGAIAQGPGHTPGITGVNVYFPATDLEATLARIESNGGSIHLHATPIGDLGTIAEFIDSEGNRIGLHFRR